MVTMNRAHYKHFTPHSNIKMDRNLKVEVKDAIATVSCRTALSVQKARVAIYKLCVRSFITTSIIYHRRSKTWLNHQYRAWKRNKIRKDLEQCINTKTIMGLYFHLQELRVTLNTEKHYIRKFQQQMPLLHLDEGTLQGWLFIFILQEEVELMVNDLQ